MTKNKLSGKRVMITGGAGFIGGSLASELSVDNHVVIFDNFSRGTEDILSKVRVKENISLSRGDVLNPNDVKKAAKDVDVIYHLASIAGIYSVSKHPTKTIEVSFNGTQNILEAARKLDVSRVIYSSTSEVYGPHAFNASEEDMTAQGPLSNPRWYYATSKLAAENLVHAYYKEYGLGATSLRYFNVYGPGQIGEGAMKTFIQKALAGKTITIFGSGTQIRAWCYISDCVNGSIMAADKAAVGQAINIGNSNETPTINELARRIVTLLHSKSRIDYEPYNRPISDVYLRIPDISKAKKILGYEPYVPLETGILKTADYYRHEKSRL
jgi:UDP-glucose 4-epimerase